MPEKSKFLQMFESLPPEEQDKVAQIAIQMSEWIVDNKEKLKKGVNQTK